MYIYLYIRIICIYRVYLVGRKKNVNTIEEIAECKFGKYCISIFLHQISAYIIFSDMIFFFHCLCRWSRTDKRLIWKQKLHNIISKIHIIDIHRDPSNHSNKLSISKRHIQPNIYVNLAFLLPIFKVYLVYRKVVKMCIVYDLCLCCRH